MRTAGGADLRKVFRGLPSQPSGKLGTVVLETPLFGRFVGENRKLVFAPAQSYDTLVSACIGIGCFGFVYTLISRLGILQNGALQFGSIVMILWGLAGVWAWFSLQRVVFDLKERTYMRRDGPGFVRRSSRGRIDDIEAITLLAEEGVLMAGMGYRKATYRLVMHWKGMTQPILVLQTDARSIAMGQPLNSAAGPIFQLGMRYAQALQLPFFDQSQVHSPCPVAVF